MNTQITSWPADLHRLAASEQDGFFTLRKDIRHSLFDAAGFWSYPALIGGGTVSLRLHLVLLTVPMPEQKRTTLFRPKALVVTRGDRSVVRYQNFRAGDDPFRQLDWNRPVAMFPHKSVATLTYAEFAERERRLLAQYQAAEKSFALNGTLPPEFCREFTGLIHPVFLPWLQQLASRFIEALGLPVSKVAEREDQARSAILDRRENGGA